MSEESTTETTPKKRGPREFKAKPTARERVLCENLAAKVKELTGRDVSVETAWAFRFSYGRWSLDPETKALMANMNAQLKRQKAQEKREKALAELREAEAELGDVDLDEDEDETDEDDNFEDDPDEDDDEDDAFADEKISASF